MPDYNLFCLCKDIHEWAAKDTEVNWTLHFSLVVGLDFKNDIVQIANPYGYMEELTIQNFIKAARFESYENMEWHFEEGFNFGLFIKGFLLRCTLAVELGCTADCILCVRSNI